MKKILVIILLISPLFLKAQSGCSDPLATNYYCNTTAGSGQCGFGGFDSTGAQFLVYLKAL